MFDNTLLAVECPHCAEYTEKSIAQLRRAASISCCRCGSVIDLSHDTLRAEIGGAIRRLKRSVERMRQAAEDVRRNQRNSHALR